MDLYQNAPVGYHSLGPDGMFLELNDTWLRMFGYQREELVNKLKITDLMDDEGVKVFKETFPRLKREGTIENVEYQLRKKNGSYLPILLSASAIYDKNGNFLKTRSIIRDISARIGYRTMLEQALEEWRKTFDSMPYGVLMIDTDFNIKRANKYFASLYDIPLEKLLGQKCFEVTRSDALRENYLHFISSNLIDVDICEHFDEILNKHFMLYLTPVPDMFGLTKSFVIALVDFTEIKDKEKKITDSKNAFFNMLKELDFSYKELKGLYEGLIHSFVNAIDAKSPWTKGHSERVTNYSLSIAKEMRLEEEEIEMLKIASLLHDIGKIGTYDVILNKPQSLSNEEINLINNHPLRGVEILKPISQLQHILPIIRHHHERLDGKGYPDGLKRDEIPMLSRIICVADSFDSMTSDRPYRPAAVKDYAIKELRTCSGTQFDPQAVEAFLRVLEKS
jgi:PAS domain S-box-containing protein/putative nucleotidyltransferase with HDIG domain